jgi:hypothetical protein
MEKQDKRGEVEGETRKKSEKVRDYQILADTCPSVSPPPQSCSHPAPPGTVPHAQAFSTENLNSIEHFSTRLLR